MSGNGHNKYGFLGDSASDSSLLELRFICATAPSPSDESMLTVVPSFKLVPSSTCSYLSSQTLILQLQNMLRSYGRQIILFVKIHLKPLIVYLNSIDPHHSPHWRGCLWFIILNLIFDCLLSVLLEIIIIEKENLQT
uniref:Uncharacterized protein n=1 Tax=Glossina brevipalpis TaxID=37001 RepID=A0A1A9WIF0_9MUSC